MLNLDRLDAARGRDGMLLDLADMQYRVVSVGQLRAIGFSKDAIRRAKEAGRLHPIFRCVYAVGTPVHDAYGRALAAVLAFDDAVLSHRSAGAAYEILRYDGWPEVSVKKANPRKGIIVHESRATDRWLWRGIPITTPERTLVDLADVLDQDALDAAVSEAHVKKLIRGPVPNRPGRRAVSPGHRLTRSQIERRYLRAVRAAGDIALPQMNFQVGRWNIDAYWPEYRRGIEFDDFTTHGSEWAFERDREKSNALLLQGILLARITQETLPTAVDLTRRLLNL